MVLGLWSPHPSSSHLYLTHSAFLVSFPRDMASSLPMVPMRVPFSPSSSHPHWKKTPSPSKVAPTTSATVQVQPYPLEITLCFDLFRRGSGERMPTTEEAMAIMALFPGCYSVECSHPFLLLRFNKLPAKPWPLKIAGLVAWFIESDPVQISFPLPIMGQMGLGPPITVQMEIPRWTPPATEALKAVVSALKALDFSPRAVQWWGWYLLAELDDARTDQLQRKFPRRINGLNGRYTYESSLRPQSAPRLKYPPHASPDSESYSMSLRPGVMLSGLNAIGDELLTTSGICVQSRVGERLITCATHGFLPGDGIVYHPNRQGQAIGQVIRSIGTTDISLIRLNPGLSYANETFSEPDYEARPFKGFGNVQSMRTGDFVYFNSPFNGLCVGNFLATDFSLLPSDEPGISYRWFRSEIAHFGQNLDQVLDSSCGATVWNDDFEVLG